MPTEPTLVFPADHPAFAGHFPGAPIVPGVLLLDAALHALAAASGQVPTGIASAKFLHPTGPDERLSMEVSASGGRGQFELRSGATPAASGQVTLGERKP